MAVLCCTQEISIMYENKKVQSVFGAPLQFDTMPLPEGQNLSTELIHSLSQLPLEMELPFEGYITPWATKKSDMEWTERTSPPEYNLGIYLITEREVRKAYDKLFGQPIPYLGFVTFDLPTQNEVENALEGTDYELYETQAVYQQADTEDEIPPIMYFHWISLRPIGEKTSKGLSAAMAEISGNLVFAERAPYNKTISRDWPAMSFLSALDSTFTEVSEEDAQQYSNPEVAAQPAQQGNNFLANVLLATAVATGVVVVGKMVIKK
jgi:hypothetical protein